MIKAKKYLYLCIISGILFLSIVGFNMVKVSLGLVKGIQDIWVMEFLIPLLVMWMFSFISMDYHLRNRGNE